MHRCGAVGGYATGLPPRFSLATLLGHSGRHIPYRFFLFDLSQSGLILSPTIRNVTTSKTTVEGYRNSTRLLAKSERYNVRYDAAKQSVPRVEVV